jgi:chemotaxis response regulator CheB
MKNQGPLIAIGASAGGLNALCEFFDCLPKNLDASFVVLMHLLRDKPSALCDIISKHATYPVLRMERNMPIQSKHIYIIIEDTTVEVSKGWLLIKKRGPEIINRCVDIFFNSLAIDFKNKAIAIIMSGSGSDGLKGAININNEKGTVLVQDPISAEVNGMPLSILHFDHPKAVMSPEQLASNLKYFMKDLRKTL